MLLDGQPQFGGKEFKKSKGSFLADTVQTE